MGSRWTKTLVSALALACAFPSGVLSAHMAREASTCHRLVSHVISCHTSQNVDPRHSHRLDPRPLRATHEKRVRKREVAARRPHAPTRPARPPRRIPRWGLEPSGGILNAQWAEPPLRAP